MKATTLDHIARDHTAKCLELQARLRLANRQHRDEFLNRLIESIELDRPLWNLCIDDLLAMASA